MISYLWRGNSLQFPSSHLPSHSHSYETTLTISIPMGIPWDPWNTWDGNPMGPMGILDINSSFHRTKSLIYFWQGAALPPKRVEFGCQKAQQLNLRPSTYVDGLIMRHNGITSKVRWYWITVWVYCYWLDVDRLLATKIHPRIDFSTIFAWIKNLSPDKFW